MLSEIAASLQSGNKFVMCMMIITFIGTMLIFERLIMLHFVYHIDFKKFLNNLKKLMLGDDLSRAISFCKGVSSTSLPHIARRALEAADTDPSTVRGTLEEETIDFLPRLEARVSSIGVLANLIMLLGVLASLDALWNTFHALNALDASKRQVSLGNEISTALVPAALGLALSMLLLLGHHFARTAAMRLTERLHHGVTVLHNLLVPADVATFMPVAVGAGGAAVATVAQTENASANSAPSQSTETTGTDNNASFEDAAVEDIRDEEEII
jgi:biopolymer transport protein ExbB/TolQ